MKNVFVLACYFGGEFTTLGVYTSLSFALNALSSKYLEESEVIEDFNAIDEQHSVVYTNMATYYINEHILEGMGE